MISLAHPEHIACFAKHPWEHYAAEPPSGQLRLASESTVSFASLLLRAAAKMFPGSYFSTGGDEVNMRCYEDDEETVQEADEEIDMEALLAAFPDIDDATPLWLKQELAYLLKVSEYTGWKDLLTALLRFEKRLEYPRHKVSKFFITL